MKTERLSPTELEALEFERDRALRPDALRVDSTHPRTWQALVRKGYLSKRGWTTAKGRAYLARTKEGSKSC